ncbi:DNA cytosine methyltransferase [Pseudanabaena sp. FACHB-1050]|uniref:Cytosine-specific methyltransferase n=1 Tax=Phormidium tenue FACHB-1050 TaxID=2692857 RepID=A0ABR8C718_9CYAN|nr:DNA cytosine methyltransferase [Phormidium tenue FACHB-1050]
MTAVDLFSGCGGLSLGFQQAGIEILAAIDNWDIALDIYRENFNHPAIQQDLSDENTSIRIIRKFAPEMIIGGSPCQDFSSAGKRDLNGDRANLTYNFANIICEIKPKWFVMENVQRITKSPILQQVSEHFIRCGYGLSSVILDASLCHVPQARSRFFMIGELGRKQNTLVDLFKINLANKPMTVRDYLGDRLNLQYYYRHPRSYARRGIFSIDEPSPTIRGVNRPIPANYKLHSGDPQDIDIATVRPLTTIERSYIQTFPESFKFFGTKTNLEQMIGNSVPVNLAYFVGSNILKYFKEEIDLYDLNDCIKTNADNFSNIAIYH